MKYIITDPCYIMDDKQYDNICEKEHCDFEGQNFPLSSTHRYTKQPITFHTIEGTPNGDGSYSYKGQWIGVDAGMLCIAENTKGWDEERHGATFATLKGAQSALVRILPHF